MKTVIENNGDSPKIGDERIISKYLWLPKTLPIKGHDPKVKRWLEAVEIRQEFAVKRKYVQRNPYYTKTEEYRGWNNIEWNDVDIIIQK